MTTTTWVQELVHEATKRALTLRWCAYECCRPSPPPGAIPLDANSSEGYVTILDPRDGLYYEVYPTVVPGSTAWELAEGGSTILHCATLAELLGTLLGEHES